jgi:hypothetical protein
MRRSVTEIIETVEDERSEYIKVASIMRPKVRASASSYKLI